MANNVNRESVVKNAMSRAAKLMQLESNGTLDKIASDPNFKANINNSLENGDILTKDLMTTAKSRMTEASMTPLPMGDNAMNVPQAIRESFANMSFDDSSLYSAFGGESDGRNLDFLNEIASQPTISRPTQDVTQIVNEGMGHQQPQATQQIDYPMIRTIVEEIVRKYAVSLKKNILNENKQSTTNEINTIALGKTFKFLDSAGNIYECTMRKVGNINKKKSVNG